MNDARVDGDGYSVVLGLPLVSRLGFLITGFEVCVHRLLCWYVVVHARCVAQHYPACVQHLQADRFRSGVPVKVAVAYIFIG